MLETVKENSTIIHTLTKSRIIYFFLIVLLLQNGVHSLKNGIVARPGDFKYIISIQLSGVHLCTGTILDETHILTIGHVLIDKYQAALSVVAGKTKLEPAPWQMIDISEIYFHPDITPMDHPELADYWHNDIAIIQIAKKFQWNIYVGPVQLISLEINWLSCPDCAVIAWAKRQKDTNRIILQQMWQFVSARKDQWCHERYIRMMQHEMCFSDLLNTLLITPEDLGSPVICNNLMVGLVTKTAKNNIEGTPSAFLKTLPYSEFIKGVIVDGLFDLKPGRPSAAVSIWYSNSYICGGSILDATHILTAAHCVWTLEKNRLKVIAGGPEVSLQNVEIEGLSVHDIIYHEQYQLHYLSHRNYWVADHDIAVIMLEDPVVFGVTIHALNYEEAKNYLLLDMSYSSFLWKHRQNSIGVNTMKLKETRVKILSSELCQNSLESRRVAVTKNQFCTSNSKRINFADGRDCGNPIYAGVQPVGILVKALPSDDDDLSPPPVVYLWLHPYKEFIHSALRR